jgi:hypothetical protein
VNLSEYFEKTKGYGVLSTADASGKIDSAIYARPYFVDDETVAFIMPERLTYANLCENPHAVYLFIQDGGGNLGKRLYMVRIREEVNDELADAISRRYDYTISPGQMKRHVVYFTIERVLPLIGPGA